MPNNWLYLAGIWRPMAGNGPDGFAILTVEANAEVSRYQSRQGALIRRNRHMQWLDLTVPERELLQPLPPRSFDIEEILRDGSKQRTLAL